MSLYDKMAELQFRINVAKGLEKLGLLKASEWRCPKILSAEYRESLDCLVKARIGLIGDGR